MTLDLAELGGWVHGLTLADVPEDVARLVRLQHLAGLAVRGEGALRGGDPFVLAGRTSADALPALWAAPPATVGELLLATVAANEVGGRVGLATLLGPRGVTHPDHASRAARWAAEGARSAPGPLDAAEAVTILPGALKGLGSRWLTRTLVAPSHAAPPWLTVPLEAVDEILTRHVKAAEKRLRADQVERIEIRLPWLGWGRESTAPPAESLAHAVGVLIAHHALGPAELADETRREDVDHVASTVVLTHDWALTARMMDAAANGLAPLLGGLGLGPLARLRAATRRAGGWPPLGFSDLAPLLRARPFRLAAALGAPAGDLAAVDLDRWTWAFPVEVKLYTSRGGWWPERRSAPRWVGAGIETLVRGRLGAAVDAALSLPTDAPAADLLALGART